jgi:hypothetical protein
LFLARQIEHHLSLRLIDGAPRFQSNYLVVLIFDVAESAESPVIDDLTAQVLRRSALKMAVGRGSSRTQARMFTVSDMCWAPLNIDQPDLFWPAQVVEVSVSQTIASHT